MSKAKRPLAFVIHDLNSWGGHDRSTLEVARRLSHRWPVEVFAFTLNDPKGMSSWGDVKFHQIKPHIVHPALFRETWFFGATLPPLTFLPRLKGRGRPLIHATGACSLVSDVVQVQFVGAAWRARLAKIPPDVCAPPFARGDASVKARAREVYHRFLLEFNTRVERRVYRKDKTYIAIAHCVAAELREFFGITDNVHVIHHGVDSGLFHPARSGGEQEERKRIRRKYGFGDDDVVALFVGAYERKGLSVAIDSLALMHAESRKRIRLLAVGGGAIRGFQERAIEKGVGDQVFFEGHTKDIAPFYRAADLFLLPTLYEPFGLVITEALASGLPSVVSGLAGASELIHDGEEGRIIRDPMDAEEIARYLEPLVGDAGLRRACSAKARALAERRSWDQVAEEYAGVLGPLLEP